MLGGNKASNIKQTALCIKLYNAACKQTNGDTHNLLKEWNVISKKNCNWDSAKHYHMWKLWRKRI
jgi:hypothetical protein